MQIIDIIVDMLLRVLSIRSVYACCDRQLTFSTVTIISSLARASSHLPVEFLYSLKQVLHRLARRGRTDKLFVLSNLVIGTYDFSFALKR